MSERPDQTAGQHKLEDLLKRDPVPVEGDPVEDPEVTRIRNEAYGDGLPAGPGLVAYERSAGVSVWGEHIGPMPPPDPDALPSLVDVPFHDIDEERRKAQGPDFSPEETPWTEAEARALAAEHPELADLQPPRTYIVGHEPPELTGGDK